MLVAWTKVNTGLCFYSNKYGMYIRAYFIHSLGSDHLSFCVYIRTYVSLQIWSVAAIKFFKDATENNAMVAFVKSTVEFSQVCM